MTYNHIHLYIYSPHILCGEKMRLLNSLSRFIVITLIILLIITLTIPLDLTTSILEAEAKRPKVLYIYTTALIGLMDISPLFQLMEI